MSKQCGWLPCLLVELILFLIPSWPWCETRLSQSVLCSLYSLSSEKSGEIPFTRATGEYSSAQISWSNRCFFIIVCTFIIYNVLIGVDRSTLPLLLDSKSYESVEHVWFTVVFQALAQSEYSANMCWLTGRSPLSPAGVSTAITWTPRQHAPVSGCALVHLCIPRSWHGTSHALQTLSELQIYLVFIRQNPFDDCV